nr:MAG TPA: hypothetical protein [Caudoviricetes sp.]
MARGACRFLVVDWSAELVGACQSRFEQVRVPSPASL